MNPLSNPVRDIADYRSANAARHVFPMEAQKYVDSTATRVIVKGEGMQLWDADGKRYLDGLSGLWCTAVGYGRRELIDAASRQMQELAYCSQFFNTTHPSVVELSEKLFGLLPDRYGRIIYTNSGSEANEVLIRTVRHYWSLKGKPEKKIFIARHNGYHGSTVGSASLGGMKYMHDMGGLPIPDVAHIGEPFFYAWQGDESPEEFGLIAARELEEKILALGADKVAAFVAEPFQGAGGAIFPPASYWPEIQRICRKHDVLICADEVIGGFGRTGEWFAHRYFGFEPDTISIAKGLTSGYVPMGGLVLSREIGDVLAADAGIFAHGLTYQGHPVAAAVALANLTLLDEGGIVDHVRNDSGPYLQSVLRDALSSHPLVGEIQGAGAVAAIMLAPAREGKKRFKNEAGVGAFCMNRAGEEGLIVRSSGARILIAPALIARHEEIDELVDKLKRAVDATARKVGLL